MVVDLPLLYPGGGGEHHGSGFDAPHGDGFEVADGDDFAILHFFDGNEAVEAGADGSDDFLRGLVVGGGGRTGGVAAGMGGAVEGGGVGGGDAAEDVADAEVDEARTQGCFGFGRDFGLLGGFFFLFFFGLLGEDLRGGGDVGGVYGIGCRCRFLWGFALADDECWLAVGGGSWGLLLLLALLFFLRVEGLVDEDDGVRVDGDLVAFVDGEPEYGGILYEIDVPYNVMVAALPSSLLGRP